MGEKIGGVVWCSSIIISGSCCDGGLWIEQVECVPYTPVQVPLEVVNNHHQVLKLQSFEVWYHRELVFVLGYTVLPPVLVILMIVFFISIGKLWIISLSVVENLAILPVDD